MTREPMISDAIYALGVDGGWKIKKGKIAKWYSDQPQPSDAAINSKLAELQAAHDAQAYARSRKSEYPPLEDQLDHIYHNGVESWKTNMVKPVKDKYPKPG